MSEGRQIYQHYRSNNYRELTHLKVTTTFVNIQPQIILLFSVTNGHRLSILILESLLLLRRWPRFGRQGDL
jgi:hypothetical protein